ncbi:MFS drug efflux transporter-like protein [Plenodomus tracheiphilus IPT5]|uniref:MFS drug efflux transporter-like protein n=1 Tax=Plenodomus tracheiphilus IPT5 TaxID=1408161 RepID=A0A6A7B5T0_9PLEO|nr:MFS drug efflux transporter-like protein [Plenodomus tracheiphilus IPT5]
MVFLIATMYEPCDSIADLKTVLHVFTHGLHNPSIITAVYGALASEEVNVLPISGIERNSRSLDPDIFRSQGRNWGICNKCGYIGALNLNSALKRHYDQFLRRMDVRMCAQYHLYSARRLYVLAPLVHQFQTNCDIDMSSAGNDLHLSHEAFTGGDQRSHHATADQPAHDAPTLDARKVHGFVIGGVAVIMPLGKLYGILNVKWLYITSVVLFMAASAVCGAAPDMNAEIVGRVFAGAGGIGMYIGTMILLSINTSEQERPTYLSLVGLVWGIGTVLGPVIGGSFEQVDWRWAFYLNLVIGALLFPVWFFLLPSFHPAKHLSLNQRLGQFDFVGALLSIGAFVTTIMPINFGGTSYEWNSGTIISLFVVTGVLWIAFAVQQSLTLFTTPTDRMFPVQFLKNKEAILLFICAAAINSAVFVPIYFIPIYFQFSRGDGALDSAIRLLPLIFLLCATILVNGKLMSRFGYYMPWYLVGGVFCLIANVFLSLLDATTSQSYIYGFEALLGLGAGGSVQAGYAVIQAVVPAADLGYAVSFIMIAQIGGIALGLACASAVFINGATNALGDLLPSLSDSELQSAISGTGGQFLETLDDNTRAQVIDAIVNNLAKAFIVAYAGAAVSLVASLGFSRKRVFLPTAAAA